MIIGDPTIPSSGLDLNTFHTLHTYLIVIHDSVEGLYPHGVYITIQHYPLGVVRRHIGHVTHYVGKQT